MGKSTKGLRIIDYTKGNKLKVSKVKPPKAKPQLEIKLQKQIEDFLNLQHDCFVWRNRNAPTFDPVRKIRRRNNALKGLADITGIGPGGISIAIEVKREGRKSQTSEDQRWFLQKVISTGGQAIVADSIKDVELLLERMRFATEHQGTVHIPKDLSLALSQLTECF